MNSPHDTEKGLPEQPTDRSNVSSSADPPKSKKCGCAGKKASIVIVVGALACLGLVVGLSVGLTRDHKSSNSSSNSNNNSQGNTPNEPETGSPPNVLRFQSPPGRAFAVSLDLLTPKVLQGYSGNVTALRQDLSEAVRMYLNSVIEEQVRYWDNVFLDEPEMGPTADVGSNGEEGGAAFMPLAVGDATDFDTNNQEIGVDEADKVKSDGEYVYSAYGNTLVVWNAASGAIVTNYTLPELQKTTFGDSIETDMGMEGTSMYMMDVEASIAAISLHGNRLVLYVMGYGPELMQQPQANSSCSGLATRVIVLDTTNLSVADLPIVAQKDILGDFRDARAIGGTIHVVTDCTFQFWNLQQYFDRWMDQFQGLNQSEYREAAALAVEPHIDAYVDLMVGDITTHGFPNMPTVSLWQSSLGGDLAVTEQAYSQGPIGGFTSLISFDVSTVGENSFQVTNAGACTPGYGGYTYTVQGMLVYSAEGWNWSPDDGTTQTTYLMGFSLDGTTAQPVLLGSFPGYMRSQYALGIHDGYLRVATTIESSFPVEVEVVSTESGTDVMDEPSVTWPQPVFETQNQVLILQIPVDEGDEFDVVASIPNLGKEGETIQAIRYFGNIGYAVTFRQTDPFYVLDLDPNNAQVLGELSITGFSAYLHSMNDNNTLLVGIGEEADENGTILGLQLTIYDASDPALPVDLHRKAVEDELGVYSSSEATFDFKAFRFLNLGNESGLVIIPVSIQAYDQSLVGNFDGFYVYDVSRDAINLRLTVSHVDSADVYGCFSQNVLPQRSLVFNGDVTTLKGHSVVSTNLDSGLREWNFTLPNDNQDSCNYWWR